MLRFVILALALVATSTALYSPSDDVIDLTPSNFDRDVLNSNDLWLIEFYAPWCGHCQQLAPEWKKAATALKGVVKVGAVDMDKHQSLGAPYGIQGFPTIKVFGSNKNKPTDYNGARSASSIVDSAMSELRSLVNSRLHGGRSGGSGGGRQQGGKKEVIELTDANFEELVLKSKDMWMVEFFAPWCGHCKSLEPHWARAASELGGKVKVGALDATVHTVMAGRYGVQGFPTIKYFGVNSKNEPEDYQGGRTSDDIVRYALDKLAANIPPPEPKQILNMDTVEGECKDHQLCIVSILPHILDCQSDCRNGYLKTMKEMAAKYKTHIWGWLWAEAAAQPDLETALGVGGFGYPAMAAVNYKKMRYALMRGAYNIDGINSFLREVSMGRGSTAPVPNEKLPKIYKSEAWDGKDGKIEVEDDIDLSDVELDPLPPKKKEEL